MTWFYISLISALCFTGMTIVSRVVSLESKHPRILTVALNLIAISMALILFFITSGMHSFSLPANAWPYFFLAVAIICYGLYERLRLVVAQSVESSLFGIINNFSVVVAFILSVIIYHEAVTLEKLAGFSMVVGSLLLVSAGKIGKLDWRGIRLALFSSLLIGVAWSLDKKGASYFNSTTYNLMVWVLPFAILYFPSVNLSLLKKEFKTSFSKLLVIALFNVTGFYLNLVALTMAEATRVMPVIQTSTIFTVIFGIALLGERENMARKTVAGIIAVAGVFLLV